MAGQNYREIVNLIRTKCRIKLDEDNKDKFVLSKDECLIILSYIVSLEEEIRQGHMDEALIQKVVQETINQVTMKEDV